MKKWVIILMAMLTMGTLTACAPNVGIGLAEDLFLDEATVISQDNTTVTMSLSDLSSETITKGNYKEIQLLCDPQSFNEFEAEEIGFMLTVEEFEGLIDLRFIQENNGVEELITNIKIEAINEQFISGELSREIDLATLYKLNSITTGTKIIIRLFDVTDDSDTSPTMYWGISRLYFAGYVK